LPCYAIEQRETMQCGLDATSNAVSAATTAIAAPETRTGQAQWSQPILCRLSGQQVRQYFVMAELCEIPAVRARCVAIRDIDRSAAQYYVLKHL
jgi:hypothetical protein